RAMRPGSGSGATTDGFMVVVTLGGAPTHRNGGGKGTGGFGDVKQVRRGRSLHGVSGPLPSWGPSAASRSGRARSHVAHCHAHRGCRTGGASWSRSVVLPMRKALAAPRFGGLPNGRAIAFRYLTKVYL